MNKLPGASAPNDPYSQPSGAASSIAGVGGYTPDWAKLIQGDPAFGQAEANAAAGSSADKSALDANIASALENYGQVPDLAGLAKQLGMTSADLQGLGPEVSQLANENTQAGNSTVARLSQANDDAIRQIRASLNARGILNSGETPFELDRQNTAYGQSMYDANAKLLGTLQQYYQGYLTAQQQRDASMASAASDAANRQMQLNQSTPGEAAHFVFQDQSTGAPVYQAPSSGLLYNADGSPYQGAPPRAPQTFSAPGAQSPITGSIFSFK